MPQPTSKSTSLCLPSAIAECEHYLMTTAQRPPVVMQHGQGSWLTDSEGTLYLDFIQGWAVNALGHCPVEIQEALSKQAGTLLSASPAFHNAPQLHLARQLCEVTGYHQVSFSITGAEANEVAVKLARKWGQINKNGASRIVTTEGSFHGRTLAMMSASGKPGFGKIFPPRVEGFTHVAYGSIDAMREAIDESTVALMVEPIQGEAGVVLPPNGYLLALRELANTYNLLLIADEIQTGCGRTGRFLALEHENIVADITTLGKGLGAGIPVSATLCNQRAAGFAPGDQGGTHCGNPVAMAVASAVVEVLSSKQFLAEVTKSGAALEQALHTVALTTGGTVRGRGLLYALELAKKNAALWVERARTEQRLLVNAAQPNILRFMPSLRCSQSEVDECQTRLLASWPGR